MNPNASRIADLTAKRLVIRDAAYVESRKGESALPAIREAWTQFRAIGRQIAELERWMPGFAALVG